MGKRKKFILGLTEKEAEVVGGMLAVMLESHFENIDQYLWLREKKKFGASTQAPVWSNLNAEEMEQMLKFSIWGAL